MRAIVLACCVGLLSIVTCVADDFAIVTAEQAYLLDDDGSIAETLPFFSVLEVREQQAGRLRVAFGDQTLWLRQGFAHLGSQFAELEQDDRLVLRKVYEFLEKAAREADDERYEQAIAQVKEARQIAGKDLSKPLPFTVWTGQYEAYLQYIQGEYESAGRILDDSEGLDEFSTAEEHLLTADFYNMRGLLLEAGGDFVEAAKRYEQGIAVLVAQPRGPHLDLAVIYDNLADALQQAGETGRAVFASKLALGLKRQILPSQAIELAFAHQRLGDLAGQNEDAEAALSQLQTALDLLQRHHPTDSVSIADTYSQLVFVRYENQQYPAAAEAAQEILRVAGKMAPDDRRTYQRLAYNWLGSIELAREDFPASLKHYQAASSLADESRWVIDDAVAWEGIGDAQLQLPNTFDEKSNVQRAKEAYEQAITIYAATEGADSEQVLVLREYSDDLESDRGDSLGGIVQVAMPQAYLLDEAGEVMEIVPGLEVLEWLSVGDDFYEVKYFDKVGRIPKSQLLFRRLLPGYGIVKSAPFQHVMWNLSSALQALEAGEAEKAEKEVQAAIERVAQLHGQDNSLHLWCRLLKASIHLRTRGPDAAAEQLRQLQEQLDSLPENAAPVAMDAKSIQGAVLATQGDARAALDCFLEARQIAEQRLGSDHLVTIQAARFAGLQAQAAGLVDADAVDVAVRELGFALTSARQVYPLSANEITDLTGEYANVLTQAEEHAETAKVLEQRFDDEVAFPKEAQVLMVAQLGRAYLNLKLEEDGRKLLATVIDVLERQPQADRMIPAALIAYGELGEHELAGGNADQAVTHLLKAIDVLNALNPKPGMRLAELHRGLASAYREQQDLNAAQDSLSTTMSILAKLGGDHKDLIDAIRLELREVASRRDQMPDRFLDPPELLAKYFLLAPPGQSMWVTRGECAVLADPADPHESVTKLEAGKKVWSLQFADPMHRIYLPDEATFGWVHRQHLRDFPSVMIESGRQKLEQALQDQPPENLQVCLDAFRRARPREGFSDPQQGISVIEESLATIQSHHKASNSLVALLHEDLIGLYQRTGNGDQVFRTTGTTLRQFIFGHGFKHPVTAAIRLQRAAAHAELGDYDAEASELQESLRTCEARFGPEDPRVRALHLRLAANRIRLGNVELAEKTYKDLLATQSLRDDQPSLLRSLVYLGLGELAASAREPDQAAEYLSSAIDDFEELHHPVPPLSARALHLLGHCHGELGEPERGIDRIVQAEQIRFGPEGDGLTLALMTKKSLLAARAGSSRFATEAADAAIQFSDDHFGKDSFKKHDPLHAKGIAIGRSDPVAAAESFAAARRITAEYVDQVLAFQSNQRRISFASDDRRRLDQTLALALNAQNDTVSENAVEFLINAQRRLPELVARDIQARARTKTQDDLTSLRNYQRMAKARANVPLKTQASQASSYFGEQIRRLDAERNAAFDKLPEDVQSLYRNDVDRTDSAWIECDRVRDRLATGEVLILFRRISDPSWVEDPAFFRIPDDARPGVYAAWIVPARGAGPIQSVSLGLDAQVEGVIRQMNSLSEFLTGLKPDQLDHRTANAEESSRLSALGDQVWQPMEGKLPPATTHLTLCLEGQLRHVPWAALPTKEGQMLVDRFTIRHVSSARDLLVEPAPAKPASPRMLLDPAFQNQDSELSELSKSDLTFLSDRTRGTKFHLDKARLCKAIGAEPDLVDDLLEVLDPLGDEFGDLFEEPEGQLVIDAFRAAFGEEAEVHLESKASEFRYFATTRPRGLQITAPTFVEPPRPVTQTAEFSSFEAQGLVPRDKTAFYHPLMQCGILLAGCGLGDAKHPLNDGVLTGEEIVAQDLRGTELVTLGVAPKVPFGSPFGGLPESEVLGMLPHAFQLAGVRAVLSNDWKTDELSTQRLLIAFYKQLAGGKEKAAALRAAQLEIRDHSGPEPVPATFWANFRLTGEGWKASGGSAASPAN